MNCKIYDERCTHSGNLLVSGLLCRLPSDGPQGEYQNDFDVTLSDHEQGMIKSPSTPE